jgi:magnesium transporter
MYTVYKRFNHQLQIVTDSGPVSKSWIRMVNPTQEEINTVALATGVPEDMLRAALDAEERSRIEIEDNCMLVLTNFPMLRGPNMYDTLPLGIILTQDQVITVSLEETEILPGNITGPGAPAYYNTGKRTRFLFQILYKTARVYIRFINQINRQTSEIEIHLRKSMNNAEVFQLLDMEKGLTYFTVALRANGLVLERLLRLRKTNAQEHLLPQHEDDEDILEDAIIENRQALEMVQMYSDILSGMMDAFTSVISNNLNQVMKLLASTTILISIPTMISSFWGMNVGVPFLGEHFGFWTVLMLSMSLTSVAGFVLWKKRMF